MILDNISRALKEQNWLAAAIEFVIVIAGVVIGLQVTAWNEARQQRALEREIICRLVEDFQRIAPDVRQHLADADETMAQATGLAQAARRGMTVDDLGRFNEVVVALRAPPAGSAVYEELISNGNIGLIRSAELRSALTDFGEHLERHQVTGNELGSSVFNIGQPIFGAIMFDAEELDELSGAQREGLQAMIGSAEFLLAARAMKAIASASRGWKASTVEKLEAVEAPLASQSTHCAGGSEA